MDDWYYNHKLYIGIYIFQVNLARKGVKSLSRKMKNARQHPAVCF